MGTTSAVPATQPSLSQVLAGSELAVRQLDALDTAIQGHIASGRYPGCQIALARHGKLLVTKTYGHMAPDGEQAGDDTLWPLLSNTKVITSVALWTLVDEGLLSFDDPVAEHLPGFGSNGKEKVTIRHLLLHQGGFPNARISSKCWTDHSLLFEALANAELEWPPGSQMRYHPRSGHWTLGAIIERVTGQDFRDVIRSRVIAPLGLERDLYVGLPVSEHGRVATLTYEQPELHKGQENTAAYRLAGIPSSGGFGTARGIAMFYQMLVGKGSLGNVRVVSRRTVEYALQNHSGDRVDAHYGIVMSRGLGPHLRGTGLSPRGLGTVAPSDTFGHGGNGSSYSWGDPQTGLSWSYLTNRICAEPWHSRRVDRLSNIVHASLR